MDASSSNRACPACGASHLALRPRSSHATGYVGYDLYVDLVAQLAASHHVVTGDAEVREFVSPFRYVWPSELDLMARIAGMKLRSRWADWDESPFTGESPSHVSVWQKPEA